MSTLDLKNALIHRISEIEDKDFFFDFVQSSFYIEKQEESYAHRDIALKLIRK